MSEATESRKSKYISYLLAGFGSSPFAGGESAPLERLAADVLPQLLRLREALDHDLDGPLEHRRNLRKAGLGVEEGRGLRLGRLGSERRQDSVPDVPEPVGQRLKPRLAGDHGLRLPLLLVREVEVLERREVERREEPRLQLGGQLSLRLDLADDERLALDDLVPRLLRVEDGQHGHLVEAPRGLLAVARDERDGATLGPEGEDGGGGAGRDAGVLFLEPGFEVHAG